MKDPGNYIPGGILEELLECVSETQKDAYNNAIEYILNHDDIELFHSNGDLLDNNYKQSLKIK